MIPKQKHIETIEKFFNKMKELSNKIDNLTEDKDIKLKYDLAIRYFNMMDIWMMLDDYTENIDCQIDIALEEDPSNFTRYRKNKL